MVKLLILCISTLLAPATGTAIVPSFLQPHVQQEQLNEEQLKLAIDAKLDYLTHLVMLHRPQVEAAL